MFNNSNEDVRDVGKKTRPDFKLYVESAKKLGIKINKNAPHFHARTD